MKSKRSPKIVSSTFLLAKFHQTKLLKFIYFEMIFLNPNKGRLRQSRGRRTETKVKKQAMKSLQSTLFVGESPVKLTGQDRTKLVIKTHLP